MQASRLSELANALSLTDLGQVVYAVLRRQLHLHPRSLRAHFHDANDPFTLPLTAPGEDTSSSLGGGGFAPSDAQRGILDCLIGNVLRGQEIANSVFKGDKSKLHKVQKNGSTVIGELIDKGMVVKKEGRDGGYFRPDAPPDDMDEHS